MGFLPLWAKVRAQKRCRLKKFSNSVYLCRFRSGALYFSAWGFQQRTPPFFERGLGAHEYFGRQPGQRSYKPFWASEIESPSRFRHTSRGVRTNRARYKATGGSSNIHKVARILTGGRNNHRVGKRGTVIRKNTPTAETEKNPWKESSHYASTEVVVQQRRAARK